MVCGLTLSSPARAPPLFPLNSLLNLSTLLIVNALLILVLLIVLLLLVLVLVTEVEQAGHQVGVRLDLPLAQLRRVVPVYTELTPAALQGREH